MDRLDRILALVRTHVPDTRIVQKRDVWWMRAVGRVLRPLIPDFETRYTTVIGNTVYLPCPLADFPRDALAATLAHELVHQLDQREWGVWFYLSYGLTPLPLWRTHRAHWERRAYAVDLMLARQIGGDARVSLVAARLRELFGGPGYGWMWGGRAAAEAYLAPVVERVRSGELQQEAPYAEILEAWEGPVRPG
ncbi:MAG: hypothetical protein R3F61_38140 [Myxococcota bacterium]